MRIAYADPPYPGCAHLYRDHPDYGGEVDHAELLRRLATFDGWILHTHVPALRDLLPLVPRDARVCSWVKPFAAFKRNVPVAYAWEPVIIKACRKPRVSKRLTLRDWIAESITLKRGLAGAKPEAVCRWAFEVAGAEPADTLADLYPGTGGGAARVGSMVRRCCRARGRARAAEIGGAVMRRCSAVSVKPLSERESDKLATLLRDWGIAPPSERFVRERLLLTMLETRWPAVVLMLRQPTPTRGGGEG